MTCKSVFLAGLSLFTFTGSATAEEPETTAGLPEILGTVTASAYEPLGTKQMAETVGTFADDPETSHVLLVVPAAAADPNPNAIFGIGSTGPGFANGVHPVGFGPVDLDNPTSP